MNFITTLKANPKIYIIMISLITTIIIFNEISQLMKTILNSKISLLAFGLIFATLLFWGYREKIWREDEKSI